MAHAQQVGSRLPAAPDSGDDNLRALRDLPGVEAVYQSPDGTLYLIAREHSDVSWDRLIELEDRLGIHLTVRAHQGRDVGEMFTGSRRAS